MAYSEQSLNKKKKKSRVRITAERSKNTLIHNFWLFERIGVPNFPTNLLRNRHQNHQLSTEINSTFFSVRRTSSDSPC